MTRLWLGEPVQDKPADASATADADASARPRSIAASSQRSATTGPSPGRQLIVAACVVREDGVPVAVIKLHDVTRKCEVSISRWVNISPALLYERGRDTRCPAIRDRHGAIWIDDYCWCGRVERTILRAEGFTWFICDYQPCVAKAHGERGTADRLHGQNLVSSRITRQLIGGDHRVAAIFLACLEARDIRAIQPGRR